MSLEAWGDDNAQELPDGCWGECQVSVVLDCIKELAGEQLYEDGQMAKGISTKFLARLTILQGEAGLIPTDSPLYREAEAMFSVPSGGGQRASGILIPEGEEGQQVVGISGPGVGSSQP